MSRPVISTFLTDSSSPFSAGYESMIFRLIFSCAIVQECSSYFALLVRIERNASAATPAYVAAVRHAPCRLNGREKNSTGENASVAPVQAYMLSRWLGRTV